MICPSCQKPLQEDFKFCPYCGAQAIKTTNCFSCGKQVEPSWLSCPYCGTSLKGRGNQHIPGQPPPPQRPPQHYPQEPYPPRYAHGRYHSSSSRKQRKKGFLGRIFSS